MILQILRTAAAFLAVGAAGYFLPAGVRTIAVLGFCLACFLHFAARIFRHRARGRSRASGVSLALAFLSLGPIIVVGLLRGFITRPYFPGVEWGAFMLAVFLTVAILRVEHMDAVRDQMKKARREDSAALERIRQEARLGADVPKSPTVRR